jgi:hypothetical protein
MGMEKNVCGVVAAKKKLLHSRYLLVFGIFTALFSIKIGSYLLSDVKK